MYVCGSADGAVSSGSHAALFYIRFTTNAGTTHDWGNSNGGSGGCTSQGGYYNSASTVTGTSSGGQLSYLSGSAVGTVLQSLCFNWNIFT